LKNDNSETNFSLINKILDIYKEINDYSREQFILNFPLIFSNFEQFGILNYANFRKKLKNLIINYKLSNISIARAIAPSML
jgi:hypothetical protein